MRKVIEHLEKYRNHIVEHLKNREEEYLTELQELDKAISWLRKVEELNLSIVQKYDIIRLPDMETGYSAFRIMNDCETDDINQWIELKKDGCPVSMTQGDVLIIEKP